MSSRDIHLVEQAKALHKRIGELATEHAGRKPNVDRMTLILSGLMVETLLEYEEADVVMEQSFHRLMTLLSAEPLEGEGQDALVTATFAADAEIEKGRLLAREFAINLPDELFDVHEIGVALILNDFPLWARKGTSCAKSLRLYMEGVIMGLTMEMAVQDLCDQAIEEFMGEWFWPVSRIISSLSALSGRYCICTTSSVENCHDSLLEVMRSEAARYGSGFDGNWARSEIANDLVAQSNDPGMDALTDNAEEFFEIAGINNALFKATALAKAAGRMMAVTGGAQTGCLHPSLAKSLARAAFLSGTKFSA